MDAKFCHICGSQLLPGTKFCGKCGSAVFSIEESVSDPFAPSAEPAVSSEPESPEIPNEEPVAAAEEVPVAVVEEVPAAAVEEAPVVAAEEAPVVAAEEAPVAAAEEAPTVVAEEAPVSIADEAPVVIAQPAPVIPSEPEPAPEPTPKSSALWKSIYPRRGVWRTILAVVLCVLIFIWSFSALTVFHFRRSVSGEIVVDSLTQSLNDTSLSGISYLPSFSEGSYDSFSEWFVDQVNLSTMKSVSPFLYCGLYIGTSYWFAGFLALLAFVCILLLARTNKWKMLRTCNDLGITLTVLGGLYTLAGLLCMLLPDLWNSIWSGLPLVGDLTADILSHGTIPSAIVLGCGIVLILIKVTGKSILLHRARNQA